jgi:hypothetical protein
MIVTQVDNALDLLYIYRVTREISESSVLSGCDHNSSPAFQPKSAKALALAAASVGLRLSQGDSYHVEKT